MSYTNEQKVVGQPCRFCGTPYVMGSKGPYCKKCYMEWKNKQENGGQKPSFSQQYAVAKKEGDQFNTVMDRKENSIAQAQDRKEKSIAVAQSKSGAGEIVAAMIHAGEVKSSDWFIKYQEIAQKIYDYKPKEQPRHELEPGEREIDTSEIPF